jgi:hypothetical protein
MVKLNRHKQKVPSFDDSEFNLAGYVGVSTRKNNQMKAEDMAEMQGDTLLSPVTRCDGTCKLPCSARVFLLHYHPSKCLPTVSARLMLNGILYT